MSRLCVVTPAHSGSHQGGAEYQIDCLLDVLAVTGRYEISYLAGRVTPGYQPHGYRVVKIGARTAAPKFGYLMDAVPLYRALAEIRPDVIYQRVACGYTGVAAYYAKRTGARLVWHIAHDTDVIPTGYIDGRNPVRRFLEKRSVEYGIRHAHRIVAQTEQQRSLLATHYGRDADAVIANFHPAPAETIDKSGPLRVLWIANLRPWKQPELFLQLAARLVNLPAVRFIMVGAMGAGSGDRHWNEALRGSIAAAPNVDYLGPLSQQEVNQLLARSHVFVNTSVHEGFPNTFIQAWMRGVPVVSLNVNPDGLFDREAVGIHAKTLDGLAQAVRMLLTDDAQRNDYAVRGDEYAKAHHSLENARVLQRLLET